MGPGEAQKLEDFLHERVQRQIVNTHKQVSNNIFSVKNVKPKGVHLNILINQ